MSKEFSLVPRSDVPNVERGIDDAAVESMISLIKSQRYDHAVFLKSILSLCLTRRKGSSIKVVYENDWMARVVCKNGKPLILDWTYHPENTKFLFFRVGTSLMIISKMNGYIACKIYDTRCSVRMFRKLFLINDPSDIISWENMDYDINNTLLS
jgi:hypothetical protein